MPRFYFAITDGETHLDPDGTDLDDVAAAKREAARYVGEWLRDRPGHVVDDGHLQVTVSDEAALTMFMISVIVTDSPAIRS